MFGMVGGGGALITLNVGPVVAIPPTVTTTLPVVAPAGTKAVIDVGAQPNTGVENPLSVIVLCPWVAPNPLPLI
jgi:hypothetical protein